MKKHYCFKMLVWIFFVLFINIVNADVPQNKTYNSDHLIIHQLKDLKYSIDQLALNENNKTDFSYFSTSLYRLSIIVSNTDLSKLEQTEKIHTLSADIDLLIRTLLPAAKETVFINEQLHSINRDWMYIYNELITIKQGKQLQQKS